MEDFEEMHANIARLRNWRTTLALVSGALGLILILSLVVLIPANLVLSGENEELKGENAQLKQDLNDANDYISRNRPLSIIGILDDLNATGEIEITIYINRTSDLENKATLTVKHTRCDEAIEWKLEFEVSLTFEEEYDVTITINGTQALTKVIFLEPLSTWNFKVWLEATWTGTISS